MDAGAGHRLLGRNAGFTLLEALIALAIAAVASAIVFASRAPNEAALAEREGRRLAALFELALVEARASGRSIAWSHERHAYAFWRESEAGGWVRFPDASPYRQRSLARGVEVGEARIGATVLHAGERLLLAPHGLPWPIVITLDAGAARVKVRGSAHGRMALERIYAG